MKPLLIRLAFWLLRVSGESPTAERLVVLHSIEDIRDAEIRLARVRARLERLDAMGDLMAREQAAIDGA